MPHSSASSCRSPLRVSNATVAVDRFANPQAPRSLGTLNLLMSFHLPVTMPRPRSRQAEEGPSEPGRPLSDRPLAKACRRDGYVMAVPVRTTPSLEIGVPLRLVAIQGKWPWRDFDVSRDGKRFLAIVPQVMANEQALTAVLNSPASPAMSVIHVLPPSLRFSSCSHGGQCKRILET